MTVSVASTVDKYQNEAVALVPYWEGPESPHNENTLPYLYLRCKQDGILHRAFAGFGRRIGFSAFVSYLSNKPVVLGVVKADNDIAGFGFLHEVEGEKGFRKASLGYAFFKKYWGQREIREISVFALRWWFQELGVEILYGSTLATNRLAVKYAGAMGFKKTGDLPKFFAGEDQLRDGVLFVQDRATFFSNFGD
jgi:RimJ/RimL family protein N-acetyltransferase